MSCLPQLRVSASTLTLAVSTLLASTLRAQTLLPSAPAPIDSTDPVAVMVGRLDLEKYKATIKGLTAFGDRRQGTKRNRDAIDWIEAQLKSYGCTNTERITYDWQPRPPAAPAAPATGAGRGAGAPPGGRGAGAPAGGAPGGGAARAATASGGGRNRGVRTRTGVNSDSLAQRDAQLRLLNAEFTAPGERQEVYCTKIGSTHPEEMYIVGGHMDGIGYGEAANDDGSGTAVVMELARIFSNPDVKTDRSIRFALWNNEESGLDGARAYVTQREALQGKESPAGSGKYPEPKWLGMVQHDMMMFDHGMPNPDGTMRKEQRPEADVNIEFQIASKQAAGAQSLAWAFHSANQKYATDYPAVVSPFMTNTDSGPFMDIIPAISLRENERGTQIGSGWDPQWHQPTDLFTTYTDKDFKLGLNAAQTTLGAIGRLTGATLTQK